MTAHSTFPPPEAWDQLQGLTEQWRALEPERFGTAESDHWAVEHYLTIRVNEHYQQFAQVMNEPTALTGDKLVWFSSAPALLEAAAKEACEARGWIWATRGGYPSGATHDARVLVSGRTFGSEANSSTVALLRAYLAAQARAGTTQKK